MYRFHPRTERILSFIHGGGLGTLRRMHASFSFEVRDPGNIRLDPALAGGALMDVGCYAVNAARAVFGREPLRAMALARWSARGVDLGLEGMLDFGDGAVAQLDCALDLPRREHVEVTGDAGVVAWPSAFLPGRADAPWSVTAADGAVRQERVPGVDQYRLMVEHMAACVRGGGGAGHAPRTSATQAAGTMAAIEALLSSARADGAPVPVG
jgi:predicted dehydrogenase